MDLIPPTLRQLEIFCKVVAHGSFRACAKALNISQAAVSDAIRQMEKRFGRALFHHDAGGASTLTAAGLRCHGHAVRVLAESNAMMAAMDIDAVPDPLITAAKPVPADRAAPPIAPKPSARLTIAIATHPSIFGHFRDQLEQFELAHPDTVLTLDMDTFTPIAVAEAFAEGRADIAFHYALGEDPALPSDYLWTERLTLFVGEQHPLASQEFVACMDLALVRPLLFSARNRLRPLFDTLLEMAGLGAAPAALESDDYGALLEHLRAGEGFFALFGPMARDFGQMEGVHRLPYIDPLPAIEVRRALRPSLRDDPVMRSLFG